MAFFKDDPDVKHASLQPAKQVTPPPRAPPASREVLRKLTIGSVGSSRNSLERSMCRSRRPWRCGRSKAAGRLAAEPGRPILRLENHKFFEHWGKQNADVFDGHFQFGGRKGIEGKA